MSDEASEKNSGNGEAPDKKAPLSDRIVTMPLVLDGARADRLLEDIAKAAARACERGEMTVGEKEEIDRLLTDGRPRDLLRGVVSNSPFLCRLTQRRPTALAAALSHPPENAVAAIIARMIGEAAAAEREADLRRTLRHARSDCALTIALADCSGAWSDGQVVEALTAFADAAVAAAVDWLLRDAQARGKLQGLDPEEPGRGCGITVLGMGKLGGRELNYSSDIDLVVFFDREKVPVGEGTEAQDVAVRLTKALVSILQEPSGDGFVLRTDLRLRPDAGATQVALSTSAAEIYFESLAQNWERAAYIKARPIAGDIETGRAFLKNLSPFIWRKYLDYATIADIHSIKRQILAKVGADDIQVEGQNVKLGRGGIREIEFFAQTQQLIMGGREPSLRERATVDALGALVACGMVEAETASVLEEAYWLLRRVEHRLQMIEDQQTHNIPKTAEGVDALARFLGFAETDRFRQVLLKALGDVQTHYAQLFESAPPLAEVSGSLVFTGVENDPDTVETLRQMGYERPEDVARLVREWHRGRLRATRSTRARALLTELLPGILRAIASTSKPDQTFYRFDDFLGGLPSGVNFFAMLHANPGLTLFLAELLGMAPRFSGYLSRHPQVLDALIAEDFFAGLPSKETHVADLDDLLGRAEHFEQVLDLSRRYAREQAFRIGAAVLQGRLGAGEAGGAYADLAEAVVATLAPVAAREMAAAHGDIPGGEMCVIAMGKLGSREMTATSDLDLIFIYDHPGDFTASDGPQSLHGQPYYARLAQRLINALTAATAEGKLYEVDMRLRPSGRAGPIATRLASFARYHETEAWTWETMALTRARVIWGPEELTGRIEKILKGILTRPRDGAAVRAGAASMRARMAKERPGKGIWDLKQVHGGLVDLEFVNQTLQIVNAAAMPDILHPTLRTALRRMGEAGLLDPAEADDLEEAARLYQNLTQLLSIAVDGPFDPDAASPALRDRLAGAGNCPDFDGLVDRLTRTEEIVRARFLERVGAAPA